MSLQPHEARLAADKGAEAAKKAYKAFVAWIADPTNPQRITALAGEMSTLDLHADVSMTKEILATEGVHVAKAQLAANMDAMLPYIMAIQRAVRYAKMRGEWTVEDQRFSPHVRELLTKGESNGE